MAGLAAAARARELGAEPLVLEKGDRPGGSMLLSSGVIWRHRTLDGFRADCPGGDPALQQVIVEQLDEAIEWLESLGAPVLEQETGNPRTIGKRFDTRGLTDALATAIGDGLLAPCSGAGSGTWPEGPLVLRPAASTCGSRASSGFLSAGTRGARETGSILRSNGAAERPARSTSSTAAPCPPGSRSTRRSSSRFTALRAVRARSSRRTAASGSKATSRGRRRISCRRSRAGRAVAPGTASMRASSRSASASGPWPT